MHIGVYSHISTSRSYRGCVQPTRTNSLHRGVYQSEHKGLMHFRHLAQMHETPAFGLQEEVKGAPIQPYYWQPVKL